MMIKCRECSGSGNIIIDEKEDGTFVMDTCPMCGGEGEVAENESRLAAWWDGRMQATAENAAEGRREFERDNPRGIE